LDARKNAPQDNARVMMEIVTLVLVDPTVRLHLVEIVVILIMEYTVALVVAAAVAVDVLLRGVLHLPHGCVVVIVMQPHQAEIIVA
jgi:hypothetical protein